MEVARIGDNKGTKYNHVAPIDLDTIPEEEKEQALLEFAEGSKGLEACLRAMWANGLKTHACCAGNDHEYDTAYIAMASGVDVFSYLSIDILQNDLVAIEYIGDFPNITIAGTDAEKENFMQLIARDITTGKKNNNELVRKKIGKPLNMEWTRKAYEQSLRRAGLSEEDIAFQLWGMDINRIMEFGSKEEKEAIWPELMEYYEQLMSRMGRR